MIQRRLSGVAFLVVIALLVGLTVALYQKAFTKVVKVTLDANSIGNQLSPHSDVKIRGVVVGEVRSVHSKGNGATIDLALQPDKVKLIPYNVVAQLLPKTLFGEKEVDLTDPNAGTGTSVRAIKGGDTIDEDHSSTAVETERVLNNLLPLLQSLKPQELSETLNAVSTALRGRGNELGDSLVRTGAYLKKLNPSLPTLQADMVGLTDLSNNLADTTPDLLAVLDNLSASSRYLVQEKTSLDTFLKVTNTFAATTQSIVAQNEAGLVALARDSKVPLALYAQYATEFPCLAAGLADYEPIVDKTFGGLQAGLHINFELIKDQGTYSATQTPKYLDTRKPYCNGLPHPTVPAADFSLNDGYRTSVSPNPDSAASAASLVPAGNGAGIAQSRAVINTVVAPLLGVPANSVPDIASLLIDPIAQGTTMSLS